jgi:hypothetical protein
MKRYYREPKTPDAAIMREKDDHYKAMRHFLSTGDQGGYRAFVLSQFPETTEDEMNKFVENFRYQLKEKARTSLRPPPE